jgi:hypothetical protein
MTKVLNLDALELPGAKSIILEGKKFEMVPFTLGEYIDNLKNMAETGANEQTIEGAYGAMINTVCRAFPGVTEEMLRKLHMPKLQALFAFVRDANEQDTAVGNDQPSSPQTPTS